jgi:heparan-alpha-glucosaminide N-acetyltransferase
MMVMIFVNDLGGVKGLPWWTYHVPADVDAMTYVDAVFPAFLFIVGMAIPLAIDRRMEKGDSPARIWSHVLLRSASLLVLGLIIANSGKVDAPLTGMGGRAWSALAFLSAIALWIVYPAKKWAAYLRAAAFLALAALLALFRRRGPDGNPAWLDFSYLEILGLIGWTYLSVCILYIPFRRKAWAPAIWLVALCGLNIATAAGHLAWLRHLPDWVWPFGNGALCSITMAGVVASNMFLSARGRAMPPNARLLVAAAYSAALAAAGSFLTPLGISKIRATPAWCLYCAAISMVLFALVYHVADVKRLTRWAAFLRPAGSNTLLTYLLPDVFYAVAGYDFLKATPATGVARSVAFTGLILACSALLTRLRIRMQL